MVKQLSQRAILGQLQRASNSRYFAKISFCMILLISELFAAKRDY
jgi:hypothetical protein